MSTTTIAGVVSGVYALDLGDSLSAAASSGATSLTVNDVCDFDEDGGHLRINGAVLEYATVDDDDSTITLVDALPAAAVVDTVVEVWDVANGHTSTVYKAVLSELDGFESTTAEAIVDQSIAHVLSNTMREGTGESVTVTSEDGELTVTAVHGRAFALAALQYLQGGMTTRQAEDETGVDILGVDSATPGLALYGAGGLMQMLLSADAAGGFLKFWTGHLEAGPGWINPKFDAGDNPAVEIASPLETGSGVNRAKILMSPGSPRGIVFVTGDFETTGDASIGGDILADTLTTDGAIHSGGGGIFMDDLAAGSATGANIGVNGRIIRTTSSLRYKDDVEPLAIEEARKVLALEPVTFKRKDEADNTDRRTYPGFIAEQAAEVGAELWVDHDAEGRPDGVRYAELTAALIPILRALVDDNAALRGACSDLRARVSALEGRTGLD